MSSPWDQASAYHWRHMTGRYFVERSRVLDAWIYLAWHKPPKAPGAKHEPIAECISPERRTSFQAAANDCAAHHRQQQQQRQRAA